MRGLVLGKFMPPHQGHLYLVDFARHYVDELTVVVGSLESEPIPGALRAAWMREIFPDLRIVHLTDENPQYPEEHPDFWAIWKASLERCLDGPLDYLFASEEYGRRLAAELGAQFIPTNGWRSLLKSSGTAIRERPWDHWEALPRPVRPYYVGRVSVFGPESTGKSTLAADLARHYGTVSVPEFARTWLEQRGGEVRAEDMPVIARGQAASEDALAYQAHRLLFCDTDPLLTTLWSQELFGLEMTPAPREYSLTLLLQVDVPWVEDSVRYRPGQRPQFFERCRQLLEQNERTYVVVAGNWKRRWETALEAVEKLHKA